MARVNLAPLLPKLCPALDAIRALADSGGDETGAICKRCEVADFVTDLVGHIAAEAERS